jgi:hypothetical protein
MEGEIFSYRIGQVLYVTSKQGKVFGCHNGRCWIDSGDFDIGMKLEAAQLQKDIKHASEFPERMGI